jgi:hypothetical protein
MTPITSPPALSAASATSAHQADAAAAVDHADAAVGHAVPSRVAAAANAGDAPAFEPQ